MTTEYEFHPIAGVFPLIEGEQYEKFKTDIAEHGQREPGVIYEGRVLEGRNRYRAQKDLGREFICDELPAGVDPYAFVISANIRRRHLTSEQATDLANKIANLKRGEHLNPPNGGFAPEQPEPPKSSQEQAASMVPGVTVRQMQRMKRLEREATDLHKKVVNEKIRIGAAEAELKRRKEKARTAAEAQGKPPIKTDKPEPAPKGKPVPTSSKATPPEETQAHIKGEPVTLSDIINAWVATRALVNAAHEMHKAAWKEELLDLIQHDFGVKLVDSAPAAPAAAPAPAPAPAPAAANGATEPVCSPELKAVMEKYVAELEQQKRIHLPWSAEGIRVAKNTKERLDFIREAAPELVEMNLIEAEAIVQERMAAMKHIQGKKLTPEEEQALARHNAKAAPAETTEVAA
jgi:hypothetical protein